MHIKDVAHFAKPPAVAIRENASGNFQEVPDAEGYGGGVLRLVRNAAKQRRMEMDED